jgi:hypothetical protein
VAVHDQLPFAGIRSAKVMAKAFRAAQCFESYVADSYAAIDAQRRAVALPEALPTLRTEFAPPPSAMLSAAETATWTTVPEQGHATTTGRQS